MLVRLLRLLGWITVIAAALAGLLVVVVTIGTTVQIAHNTSVEVTLPMTAPLPADASAPDGTAHLVHGVVNQADITGRGFSTDARSMLIAGNIVGSLATLAVLLTFVVIVISALRSATFSRTTMRITIAAAVTYLVGTAVGVLATSIGSWLAAAELTNNADTLGPYQLQFVWPGTSDLGWVLLAFVVVLVMGQRLRRDTDGLV